LRVVVLDLSCLLFGAAAPAAAVILLCLMARWHNPAADG
jgi:hypothetical protein